MARFRRKRSRSRSFGRMKRRSYGRSSGNGMGSLIKTAAIAGVYGAVREPIATVITPITNPLQGFLGNASDEVVLLTGGILLKKFGKRMPMSQEIGNAIIAVEAARIGELIRTGNLQGNSNNNTTSGQVVYS